MTEPKLKTPSKRWRFRFSISFLLFLMTCVAGYFFGYQTGYDSGAKFKASISTKIYYVEDLIKPLDASEDWSAKKKDFNKLIDLITSTVSANEWKNGTSQIRSFPSNRSLIVECRRSTHGQLGGLLHQLRRIAFAMPKNFLNKARSVAHRGKPSCQIIKTFPKISEHLHSTLANNFHSAVGDLSDEFGSPVLNITSEAPVFPNGLAHRKLRFGTMVQGNSIWRSLIAAPKEKLW